MSLFNEALAASASDRLVSSCTHPWIPNFFVSFVLLNNMLFKANKREIKTLLMVSNVPLDVGILGFVKN